MRVIACDPYLESHQLQEGIGRVELDVLFKLSDVVSLPCPLDEATQNLLDSCRLGLSRKGAIVVNTVRTGLFRAEPQDIWGVITRAGMKIKAGAKQLATLEGAPRLAFFSGKTIVDGAAGLLFLVEC